MTALAFVVLSTAPSEDEAARLARSIVEARVAACVNIVPGVRSIYRYGGAIHDEREHLLVIKTPADRLDALEAHLRAEHPYDVPEIIALPIEGGSRDYLAFLLDETRDAPG